MKNLIGSNQYKTKGINKKTKAIFITIIGIIIICLFIRGFQMVNSWYQTHYFDFKSPVEVKLNQPITVREVKPIVKTIVLDYPDEIDTPIKKYICDKFGVYDCKTALAIVQAESGFYEESMHFNDNGTYDAGLWQINQIHIKSPKNLNGTITLKDALDAYKATDWAYAKFKRDGNFNAWVAFSTNRHLAFYK